MSNFWLGLWPRPQIKPELAFAGFYLASLGCYWKSIFQILSQTFPDLTSQYLVWFEFGDYGRIMTPSEAVR
jgi:hypothetical protein